MNDICYAVSSKEKTTTTGSPSNWGRAFVILFFWFCMHDCLFLCIRFTSSPIRWIIHGVYHRYSIKVAVGGKIWKRGQLGPLIFWGQPAPWEKYQSSKSHKLSASGPQWFRSSFNLQFWFKFVIDFLFHIYFQSGKRVRVWVYLNVWISW